MKLGSPRRVALALGSAQLVLCALTVSIAVVNVLWILTVGSVVATLGVVLILVLEAPPWFERRGATPVALPAQRLAVAGGASAEASGSVTHN
jgi:hypothetical protein